MSEITRRKITIDLDESKNARHFEKANLIQLDALESFEKRLDLFIKEIARSSDLADICSGHAYQRTHGAIGIFGRRGDGKSSFLLHIAESKMLKDKQIVSLPIVDPTLIEDKENAFVTILSLIKHVVDKALKSNGVSLNDDPNYRVWKKALMDMARGIRLLDKTDGKAYHADQWEDEQYLLEQGLKDATSGYGLEKNFNRFLESSLMLMGDKKAFFLAFDDVDTRFGKGWAVLELMRKYLTSPRLLLVLSGDLELYSKLVRKQQWEMLGDLPERDEAKARYRQVVDQLEEQYLLKLLQVENRIRLKPLYDYHPQKDVDLQFKKGGEVFPFEGEQGINSKLEDLFFAKHPDDLKTFIPFLFREPGRTVLQLISSLGDTAKKDAFYENLADIFFTKLDVNGFRLKKMLDEYGTYSFEHFIQDIVEGGLLPDFQVFRPRSGDPYGLQKIILGAVKSHDISSRPSEVFDFWIKVCLPFGLDEHFEEDLTSEDLAFLEIGRGDSSLTTARKTLGLVNGLPGAVQIYTETLSGRGKGSVNSNTKVVPGIEGILGNIGVTPESVSMNTFKNLSDQLKGKYVFSDILFSKTKPITSESSAYYSFLNLLGVLDSLLEGGSEELQERLSLHSNVRTYSSKTVLDSGKADSDEEERDDEASPDPEIPAQLPELFSKWCAANKKGISMLPLYVFKRMFERMWHSFQNFKEQVKDWDTTNFLGDTLHRHIVIFLNSVLVEEARCKGLILNQKNPVMNDKNFLNNLKKITLEDFPFFNWLWSCPFWGFYLKPEISESGEATVFESYKGKIHIGDDTSGPWTVNVEGRELPNLYYPLNTVAIIKNLRRDSKSRGKQAKNAGKRVSDAKGHILSYLREQPIRGILLNHLTSKGPESDKELVREVVNKLAPTFKDETKIHDLAEWGILNGYIAEVLGDLAKQ